MSNGPEEVAILKLSMQTLKEHYGLNPGKHSKTVRAIGYQLGTELANMFHSNELNSLFTELSKFWVENGIGEMSWEDEKQGLFAINFCSDCLGRSYGAGYTLCPFKEGLLEAVFDLRLGRNFKVTEIECCGTRSQGCLFQLEYNPEKSESSKIHA
jgi:predicted hydrocarbon binding protein